MDEYQFYPRSDFEVTQEMKLMIAASAVTLTFGFRNYRFKLLNKILIYPDLYVSTATKRKHKGEYNPRLKTLVFSWKDYLKGYEVNDDNINLGIHEFTHVIHINSYKAKDVNSMIFRNEYQQLKRMIQGDQNIKDKLVSSNYVRRYAFHNQYEFIAVLIENFIETPETFKVEFPEIYRRIKRMLNFNFLHY